MTFYEKYQILCREAGKSTSFVANAIGLNNSSVTCWKRGSQPKAETIKKLSEYFGVSVDYLIGLTRAILADKTVKAANKQTHLT